MAIELTDDGTLDTVLRCSECGEEMRYTYQSGPESDEQADELRVALLAREETVSDEQIDAQIDAQLYQDYIDECIEDAENDHECPLDSDEPAEDDLTTEDHRTFYQNGKRVLWTEERWNGHNEPVGRWYCSERGHSFSDILGDFGDDHKAAIRAYMELTQFWSNVWFISDHGNAHLIEL